MPPPVKIGLSTFCELKVEFLRNHSFVNSALRQRSL